MIIIILNGCSHLDQTHSIFSSAIEICIIDNCSVVIFLFTLLSNCFKSVVLQAPKNIHTIHSLQSHFRVAKKPSSKLVTIICIYPFLFPSSVSDWNIQHIRLYFIVHDILMDVKKQLFPCKFCFKNLIYYLPVVPGEVGNLLTVSSISKVLR